MGFNSVLVVMNDALHQIADDAQFGKKVSDAIKNHSRGGRTDISSGGHVNAASVVSCEHADTTVVAAIGGNHATLLLHKHNGGLHLTEDDQIQLLKSLADKYGYSLRKKPTK